MRALDVHPVEDTRRTYRALVDAMARPGSVASAPDPADRAAVATLVDHEVGFTTDDERLRAALSEAGRLDDCPTTDAEIVHASDPSSVDVAECRQGSLREPSDGATVIYRVSAVEEGDAGALPTVELAGPGIEGTRRLSVDLPPAELQAIAAARDYPRGIDVVFAGADRLAAVPRSTTVEVA